MNSLLLKLLCWEEKDRLELSSLVLPKMLWEIFFFFLMAKNSVSLHVYMVHIVCLLTNTVQLLHPPKWCLTRHGLGTYQYTRVYSLTMEKAMAPHSSTLAWKIPWIEEPGRLQSMGSLRVGHD